MPLGRKIPPYREISVPYRGPARGTRYDRFKRLRKRFTAQGGLRPLHPPASSYRRRSPYTQKYKCQDCGAVTSINLIKGHVHSHQMPGGTKLCQRSDKVVLAAHERKTKADLKRKAPAKTKKPEQRKRKKPSKLWQMAAAAERKKARRYFDGDRPSTSVRTVSGGLPTLGER